MRTFTEREARAVFARAARDQQAAEADGTSGLTLAELQEIGRASGLDPDRVAAAARVVALGEPETGRETRAGVATGVSHTAMLASPPSDALWDALVADARRTFGARGKTDVSGHVREWRNGNLAVALEPAGAGSRLSARTRRGDAAPVAWLSAGFALVFVVVAVTSLLAGGGAWPGLPFALLSAALGGATWARQRAWAATREGQMRGLTERAAALAAQTTGEAPVADVAMGAPGPAAAPAGRLDLDLLDEAAPATDSPDAPRRARA